MGRAPPSRQVVDDGRPHRVGVEYCDEDQRYYVLVDGEREGSGLRPVPLKNKRKTLKNKGNTLKKHCFFFF